MQEGEDAALAKPVTENLNAVLQLLQYDAVRARCCSWHCVGIARGTAQPTPALVTLPSYLALAAQVRELSLSGNQLRSDMLRRRLRFRAGDSLTNSTWAAGTGLGSGDQASGKGREGEAEGAALVGVEVIDCRSESGLPCWQGACCTW